MPRFTAVVMAKPRKHNGQEFSDYWFLGQRWSGTEEMSREVSEEELVALRNHESEGYPIRVIEAVEILSQSSPAVILSGTVSGEKTPPWAKPA